MIFNNLQSGMRRSMSRTNAVVSGRFRSNIPNFSNVPKNATVEEANAIHDSNVEEARERADAAKEALLMTIAEVEAELGEMEI